MVLIFLGGLGAGQAVAASMSYNHTFQTSNQSMWGSGGAFVLDFNRFFGSSWNAGSSGGSIDCIFILGCWGATGSANTHGRTGLEVGVHLDSGTVNASLPVSLAFGFPDPGALRPGETFRLTSDFTPGTGTVNTHFPRMGAYASLILEAYADASWQVCTGFCFPPASLTLVNLAVNQELLAINRNGDSQLRVFGFDPIGLGLFTTDVVNQQIGDFLNLSYSVPNLDTSGSGTGAVNSSGSLNLLHVGADVDRMFPSGLTGNLPGVLDWAILDAFLTLDLNVAQSFALDPLFGGSLHIEETGETIPWAPGDDLDLVFPAGYRSLHVTPQLFIASFLRNNTDLNLSGSVQLSGGTFHIFGAGFGPLYSENLPFGQRFDVFDERFALEGWNSFTGPSFEITTDLSSPVPEPATLLLVGSGLLAAGSRFRRRPGLTESKIKEDRHV
jgi:hypothetical protein